MALTLALLSVGALIGSISPSGALPTGIRLNEMQVIGTHNSYHIEPSAQKLETMIKFRPDAVLLQYTHPPLPEQFENEGVRQIELDVFADPTGTLWRPKGRPGFKVFHIEQVDMDSTCEVLVDCLGAVKSWSDAHPAHLPITILLEIKDDADINVPPNPVPMTSALLHDLDDELRSVFPPNKLITPDDIRGAHATLEEAVLTDGWPEIDDVRGRVMFVLDNRRDQYIDGDASLQGRPAFPPSTPGQPDAAFVKVNDPTGANHAYIQDLVTQGYVVRTRADAPVETPQSGDTTQRDMALSSGAQWVSTDYPIPGMTARFNSTYVAQIPGGTPARCNPVNAPPGCVTTDIEDLAGLAATTTTTAPVPTTTTTALTPSPRAQAVNATPSLTG
jgi:hypothetical protein